MNKPGWQTTEFWMHLGLGLWTVLSPAIPAPTKAIIVAAVTTVYGVGRVVVKAVNDAKGGGAVDAAARASAALKNLTG